MTSDPRLDVAMKYYHANLDDEAWAIVREIVQEPDPATEALHFAATLRFEARALDEAVAFCERILARAADDVHALLLKGRAKLDQGDAAAAVMLLQRAAEVEPTRAAAHFNLGLALERTGRLADAVPSYRRAVELQDVYPVAWNNLGSLLDQLGQPVEAIAALEKAIAQLPQFSAAHNNLGVALAGQGRFSAAARAQAEALRYDPANLAAAVNAGIADVERGQVADGLARFDDVLARQPDHPAAHDNRLFALHYIESDPARLMRAHQDWGRRQRVGHAPAVADPDPRRRLRVGYVSPDFRRHSVSFFVEGLLRAHDRAHVEVFCYAHTAQPDDVTLRLRAAADHWRDIVGLGTETAVDLIRRDRIDILVDLAGHTQGHRLDLFAARAAPIQVTGLGYPDTTGLGCIDAKLCDAVTDPPGSEAFSTEALARIPMGLHCYTPPGDAPAASVLPARDTGAITFGSFNKLAKISDPTIALWSDLLAQVPGARLVLKTKPLAEAATRDVVIAKFSARGVPADRLELLGWAPEDRAHLGLYGRVDIALDTTPYNGTTTTCEALWMGVPVLTLATAAHAGRVGASLLTAVGLGDWIAASPTEFVAKGKDWAGDLTGLAVLRARLRRQVAGSSLCDAVAYARRIEGIYRELWRKRCAAGE
jgi:predicted O-linked N-acetylglucosamine transferase (SPINDLY family)